MCKKISNNLINFLMTPGIIAIQEAIKQIDPSDQKIYLHQLENDPDKFFESIQNWGDADKVIGYTEGTLQVLTDNYSPLSKSNFFSTSIQEIRLLEIEVCKLAFSQKFELNYYFPLFQNVFFNELLLKELAEIVITTVKKDLKTGISKEEYLSKLGEPGTLINSMDRFKNFPFVTKYNVKEFIDIESVAKELLQLHVTILKNYKN